MRLICKFYCVSFRFFERHFGEDESFAEKISRMAFLFSLIESILVYTIGELITGNLVKFAGGKFLFVLPALIIMAINSIYFYFKHNSILKRFG